MERFRIFISQIVTSIVVAVLAMWFCRHIIICTGLISRFVNLQIHHAIPMTLLIGLLAIAASAVKIILWLMKRPITEREITETEMGTIENIPVEK